tara:strand:- start:2869 stop:7482 length:4614 start_codon:yes stop_codon:yes gene_type:complete
VIYINDIEEIPEYERIYKDDEIYIKDLENTFLDMFSVTKQGTRYVQTIVQKKVNDIINVKKIGDQNIKCNNKYILDILNKKFSNFWIVPVVKDKFEIFSEIVDDDYSTEYIYGRETPLDKDGIVITDQRIILDEYDKNEIKYDAKKITLEQYLKNKHSLFKSYKLPGNITGGYKLTAKTNFNAIRFNDIDSKQWKQRVVDAPIYTTVEVKDPDNKNIKYIQKKELVIGETVNIVGFLVFGINQFDILDLIGDKRGISRFGLSTSIKKIIVGKRTKITSHKHNLKNNDKIYIKNSNSVPPINGSYIVSIIDDNNFNIELDSSGGKNGTKGDIYTNLILDFKTINIKKKNGTIVIDNDSSNMKNAKLFLFDSFEIDLKNDSELNDILSKIIPDNNAIIGNLYDEIKDTPNIKTILKTISKYNINLNNINKPEYDLILNILKKNILKESPLSISTKLNKKLNDKLKDDPYKGSIFNYKNINKFKNVYGEYPLLNNVNDSLESRIQWINSQPDKGFIFYDFIVKIIPDESIVKKKMNSIVKKELNSIVVNKNAPEYTVRIINVLQEHADLINNEQLLLPPLPTDKILLNGELYSSYIVKKKTRWVKDKEVYKKNDKALYIRYLYSEEYMFDGTKWKFIKKLQPHVRRLGIIENDLHSSNIKHTYGSFLENIDYGDHDPVKYNVNTFKRMFDKNKNKTTHNNNETVSEIEIKPKSIPTSIPTSIPASITIQKTLQKISNIDDELQRNYLLFKLIRMDGITINNYIYSKKYKSKIMCGHWNYIMQMYDTNSNGEKEEILNKMLTIFGDVGENSNKYVNCHVCGNVLSEVEFDDVTGFSSSGSAIHIGTLLDDTIIKSMENKDKEIYMSTLISTVDPHTDQFKKDLIFFNIDQDKFKKLDIIAYLINSFNSKIGIRIKREDYYTTLVDSYKYISELLPYTVFKKKQMAILISRGENKEKIKKIIEREIFKKMHKDYINKSKYSIVGSRLLVAYQTGIPSYKKIQGNTNCAFYGFNNDYINFMTCLIEEMNRGLKYVDREFVKYYDLFKNRLSNLYDKKHEFDKIEKEKKKLIKILDDKLSFDINKIKIPEKASLTNITKFQTRQTYIGLKIKGIINKVMSNVLLTDNIEMLENSCCEEDISKKIKYINYIETKNKETIQIINESYEYSLKAEKIITFGTVSRLLTTGEKHINIPSIDFVMNKNSSVISSCDILNIKNPIDKSAATKFIKNISEDDVVKEYNKMMNKIGHKLNLNKIILNEEKQKFTNNLLLDLNEPIVFLNEYLRKYLWMIKNNYKKTIEKISFADSETSKIMQEIIYRSDNIIEPFLKSSSEFNKIKIEYTMEYLDNLLDNFDSRDKFAVIISYLLFSEMNKIASIGDNIISNFLFTLIKKYNEDKVPLKISNETYDKFVEKVDYYNKLDRRQQEGIKERKLAKGIGEFIEPTILDIESDENIDKQLEDTFKIEYMETHGVNPNEDQVESYKEVYYSEIKKDKEVFEENYLTIQPHQTNENMSMGDDYGEMPQGTENYGDGMSEVTNNYDTPN